MESNLVQAADNEDILSRSPGPAGLELGLSVEQAGKDPEYLPAPASSTSQRVFSPLERKILALHLDGYTAAQISHLVGPTPQKIHALLRTSEVQELLAEVAEYHKLELAQLTGPAIGAVRRGLNSGNENVALKAADMVFNSQGINKQTERTDETGEDVVRRMMRVIEEKADGSSRAIEVMEEKKSG